MTQTPLKIYQHRIAEGSLAPDPAQEKAVQEFQRLFDEILEDESKPKLTLFQKIAGRGEITAPKGIYIYGGVGRGKSMLMDLFFTALPERIKKRRVHFHEFMIEVHDYVHSRQMDDSVKGMIDQALPSLAEIIARRAHVLCFDEFHVSDIADAMILGRLFRILFEHGVIIVATTNWPPDRLYESGLQRDRFLPFIALLKQKVNIVHLDSPNDYRALAVQEEGTYFYPLSSEVTNKLDHLFNVLTDNAEAHSETIEVKGRAINVSKTTKGVARFSFDELCNKPLGAEDYLKIANAYHTIFLEGIPKLDVTRRNEAKRLMNLIDALYEMRRRVIISAEVPPHEIYAGHHHAFEFERTISRLLEMQSKDYP